MASIALCEARARDARQVEEWAELHPDHPAAGPILAAINPNTWALFEVTAAERQAARAAAGVGAEAAQEEIESAAEVAEARRYLRLVR